jgi:hypothetical protein
MGKVGRFVVDPKAGAYCDVTLDSGDRIIVNHDKGGFKGGHVTLEKKKWMGLGSDQLCTIDLDSAAGKAALARLTAGVPSDSALATPLGAVAEFVKDCRSVEDVKTKCEAHFRA